MRESIDEMAFNSPVIQDDSLVLASFLLARTMTELGANQRSSVSI